MIRPGRPADLPALRALQARSLDSPQPELLDLATRGAGAEVLVTTEGDEPVGYVLAVADERADPGDGGRDGAAGDGDDRPATAYLAEVVVKPTARREGRATGLLAAVVDRLAVERLRLTVRADDGDARAFYRAVGFEPVDRLRGHYDDGEARAEAILLAREA